MASNPFYPGYIPDPYGKGTPIRRPVNPIHQLDAGLISQELDGGIDILEETLQVPMKELRDDVKRAFTIYVSPSTAKYGDIPEEHVGDIQEAAGVQIGVNLNPIDWAKDPQGMAKDLANGIVRSTTGVDVKKLAKGDIMGAVNLEDLDTFTETNLIWKPLVDRGTTADLGTKEGFADKLLMENLAGEEDRPLQLKNLKVAKRFEDQKTVDDVAEAAVNRKIEADIKAKDPTIANEDLWKQVDNAMENTEFGYLVRAKDTQIKGGKAIKKQIALGDKPQVVEVTNNLMDQAAEDFKEFTRGYKSGFQRNTVTRKAQQSFISAAAAEAANSGPIYKGGSYDLLYAVDDVSKTMSGGKIFKYKMNDSAGSTIKDSAGNNMMFYKEGSVGGSLGGLQGGLSKIQLQGRKLSEKDVQKTIDSYEDLMGRVNKNGVVTETGLISLAKKEIEDKRKAFAPNSRELSMYNGMVKEYERYLNDLEGTLSRHGRYIASLDPSKPRMEVLRGVGSADAAFFDVARMNRRFSHGQPGGGVQDRFLYRAFDEFIGNEDISRLDGARRLQRYGSVLRRKYDDLEVQDFMRAVENGIPGLVNAYAWPVLKMAYNRINPNSMVGKVINPTHTFGLNYDPTKKSVRTIFKYKTKKGVIRETSDIKKTIENGNSLVGVDYDDFGKGIFKLRKNVFNVKINNQRFKVTGGVHFTASFEAARLLKDGHLADDKALVGFFNNSFKGLDKVKADFKDIDELKGNMDLFRLWLKNDEQAKKLGIIFNKDGTIKNTKENAEKLRQLSAGIYNRQKAPGLVNALHSHTGLLNKLTERLSIIQSAIFNSKIGRLYTLPEKIKQFLASRAADSIIYSLTAATGGVGSAVLVPLRKVLIYVTRKVIDTGEKIIRGILKGDFSGLFDDLQKAVIKTLQAMALLLSLPLLILLMIGSVFFGNVFTTLSPTDPTREVIPSVIGGIYGRSGYTGAGIDFIKPDLTSSTDIKCLKFQDATGTLGTAYATYQLAPWEGKIKDNFVTAAQYIAGEAGGRFLDTVCSCIGSDLLIFWSTSTVGFCGEATSYNGTPALVFSSTCVNGFTNKPGYVLYLLAHEIGHKIYGCQNFKAGHTAAVAQQKSLGAPSAFGTYIIYGCFTNTVTAAQASENFADLIGNWFQINVWDCSQPWLTGDYSTFWNMFPAFYDFAKNEIFN
jgi:hypothetical protein